MWLALRSVLTACRAAAPARSFMTGERPICKAKSDCFVATPWNGDLNLLLSSHTNDHGELEDPHRHARRPADTRAHDRSSCGLGYAMT